MSTILITTCQVLITAAGAASPKAAPQISHPVSEIEAQLDTLARQAHNASRARQGLQMARRHYKAQPKSYAAAWRLARAAFFLSYGHAKKSQRERLSWEGYEAGLQATRLRPDGVEGHYWAGCALGEYAQAAGIAASITKGVGGKIERLFTRAVELDPSYNYAGPLEALGRYYFALPWPLCDLQRSRELLQRAVDMHPRELRAQAYLADTLAALDQKDAARRHYQVCSRIAVDPEIEMGAPRWKAHCLWQLQK